MQLPVISSSFNKAFIMLLFLVLSGCTNQLLNDAKGIKVTSHKFNAKIINAYKSDDGNNIYVCVNLSDKYKYNNSNQLFTLPLTKSDGINEIKISGKKHYFYYNRNYNLKNKCIVTKNKIDIIKFEINNNSMSYYNKTNQSDINKILGSRKDALYVAIEKEKPVQVGYISSIPIINSSNVIHAPINNIFTQDTTENIKPYLYLGIPVTVAVDVAVVGIGIVAVSGMMFGMVVAGP
ncbi:MAG: hypothetical protein OQK98_11525 [Gammaproteobacteria bacterium]|nr:hypothetical protein [Gammaproteobacteria bacterium]